MQKAFPYHGPLARYIKLRFTHAPGIPGTFSPLPGVSDSDMHHGTCIDTCTLVFGTCVYRCDLSLDG